MGSPDIAGFALPCCPVFYLVLDDRRVTLLDFREILVSISSLAF